MGKVTRREFLSGMAGALLASASPQSLTIPNRPLGKTGVKVPLLAIGGGSAFVAMSDEESERYLQRALELGLTFWDTAHIYGNGVSETRMGRILKTERKRVLIATKTRDRTYDGAMREVELSLKRLQTDRLDLIQIHDWHPKDDPVAIAKKDGVLTALRKLRDEKIVRFIGVTGHIDAEAMRKVLELYDDLNTVLMPINPAQPRFEEKVVPIAQKKGIAVLALKVLGLRSLLIKADVATLLRYAWSAPIATAAVGMTGLEILETNAKLAADFRPMSYEERQNLRQRFRAARIELPYLAANYVDGGSGVRSL